ncbi:MAG: hypothetical protein M3N11_03750 [Actinomycetota bacterium]|nr:hypothetical protein [Actinomycetota bacterium]
MTADAPSTAGDAADDQDHVYYRWAGFLLRHPRGDPSRAEILKVLRWTPAPAEAVSDVSQLPDDHPPGGWCARLSHTEAARMAAGFGVSL